MVTHRFCLLGLLTFLALGGLCAQEASDHSLNVRTLGAVGDGKADDTKAIQAAIGQASGHGGEIYLPAGTYRITDTLVMSKLEAHSVTVRGQGGSPYGGATHVRARNATTLLWDGDEGGTLWRSEGAFGSAWRDLNFDGGGKAGILYLATSPKGWGNMINSMSHVHFFGADVGIQMAEKRNEFCCSDYRFDFVTFGRLGTAFLVKNDQGVDFLFNYVFALNCDTLLNFERGGNLMVNNAQLTHCKLFLNIGGGGRNTGTYLANNVRIESGDGGREKRFQLLHSRPKWRQANVTITGYDDCQWAWHQNQTAARTMPLCEIGPGTRVSIKNSIFNSPLAHIEGTTDAGASLITRGCSFGYVKPAEAVSANEHGHFRLLENVTDKMVLLPDVVKWPEQEAQVISASGPHTGESLRQDDAP